MAINFGLLNPNTPIEAGNAFNESYKEAIQQRNQNALAQSQLRAADMQNQLQQYQLSSAKRSDELQNNLLAELKSANGDPEQIKNALIRAGKPQDAFKLQSDQAQLQKTQAETQKMHFDFTNQAARDLAGNPSDENIKSWAGLAVRNGVLDMNQATSMINHVSSLPPLERSKFFAGMGANAEQKLKQFTPEIKPVILGGVTKFVDQNSYTNPNLSGQQFQHIVTPDAVLSSQTAIRGQNLTDARARDRLAQENVENNFTPEAIANAAARYNIDGTLPPMGMGKTGAMGRAAILNKAAELASQSGLSGDEQRIQQIGNKANTSALTQLQKQQSMVGAFEKNFNKNADITLELSNKVDRTGTPLINKWLNAGKRSIAGDADLAAYDQSIKSTVNEYTKIISGSMGNTATAEGEIKKIESMLNSAQTPQQVTAVVNLMKRETQNRMAGFEEEKKQLRDSMSANKKPATVSIKPAAKPSLDDIFK